MASSATIQQHMAEPRRAKQSKEPGKKEPMQVRLPPTAHEFVARAIKLTNLTKANFMRKALEDLSGTVMAIHTANPELGPKQLTQKVFEAIEKMKDLRDTLTR